MNVDWPVESRPDQGDAGQRQCSQKKFQERNLMQGPFRLYPTLTHLNPESRLDSGQGPEKDASIQARSDSHCVKDNLNQTERETKCKVQGLNPG